jgi:hypothetical protein
LILLIYKKNTGYVQGSLREREGTLPDNMKSSFIKSKKSTGYILAPLLLFIAYRKRGQATLSNKQELPVLLAQG